MALRFRTRASASDRARRDCLLNLMTRVRALLEDHNDAVVSVSDHICSVAECSETPQTSILILRPDQPARVFKIDKPLTSVTQTDISIALAPLLGREPAP